SRPGGRQHRYLAQAPASCAGALWSVAGGLLSLISPELLLHRQGNEPPRDHLCHGCQDTTARIDLAATSGDPGEGARAAGMDSDVDSDGFVINRKDGRCWPPSLPFTHRVLM